MEFEEYQLACCWCGEPTRLGGVQSSLCLSFGVALHRVEGQDAGEALDLYQASRRLLSLFEIRWHGAHEKTDDPYSNVDVAFQFEDPGTHQTEMFFCSTQCVRDWFSRVIDDLEARRERLKKLAGKTPMCDIVENPNFRRDG